MDNRALKELIHQGESQTVECKENFDNEAIETAVAFANTKGGDILIGVSDKRQVKGTQIGKGTIKDWANRISQSTDPCQRSSKNPHLWASKIPTFGAVEKLTSL